MKNIHKILKNLFYEHDCIIIPEFGGFILNYESAYLNQKNNSFIPPRKTISFNKRLNKNDGILINEVKDNLGISYKAAKKIIEEFTIEIKNRIEKLQEYEFEGIGIIKLDQNKKLIFIDLKETNFLSNSFGLEEFKFYPIKEEKSVSIKKQTLNEYKYISRAAAIIMPLIIIASLAIMQENKIVTTIQKISTSNILDFSIQNEDYIKKEYYINQKNNNLSYLFAEEIKNTIYETQEEINHINNLNKKVKQNQKKYKFYIINGSFSKKKYAIRLNEKLKKQGFDSFVMKIDNRKRYKVCSFATNNKDRADRNFNQIKKLNNKVWLLKI